jgi:hypothetical protein
MRRDVKLTDNSIVTQMRRNTNITVVKVQRWRTTWDIAVFNQYARDCPDPATMDWLELRALAAGVLVVYLPCRFIALVRIDTSTERRSPDGREIVVLSQEKTDYGRGRTELVFRQTPEKRLSPFYYYELLHARAIRLGCPNVLFCSDRGLPYARSDVIGKSLKGLMHRMGIDPDGKEKMVAYSWRTSLIQALFDQHCDEK